ncbi:winged helix-turn-helix transcriptional regulator [Limosilactobacillus sp.]|jgi:DNA-binding HxlR family transcriptional regulator|uniref:winged helix-turn-helix transcriptional regulator n=1 Tax=Limosilactobacillus sp. TaxID=2773925 RepID=UPI0025BCE381|nr:helix-turn-helix domain-containing protein [Limosilactobacillus sp.]MCH3921594.1 helix-turn-helix transcriptional regulator [Limosilactobacillus sp.]MCH3928365.1 helix-turn-helix transcriptional regulator [Limosilactobacillus sp.]
MYQRKTPKKYYCTVDFALDIFGGKWKPRLLCILGHNKALRYGELKAAMEDISDAALADSLKELQQAGIISRQQYNEMPIRVEYSLTATGQSLLPVLDTISDWAVQHSSADIYSGQHFQQVHFGAFEQHD